MLWRRVRAMVAMSALSYMILFSSFVLFTCRAIKILLRSGGFFKCSHCLNCRSLPESRSGSMQTDGTLLRLAMWVPGPSVFGNLGWHAWRPGGNPPGEEECECGRKHNDKYCCPQRSKTRICVYLQHLLDGRLRGPIGFKTHTHGSVGDERHARAERGLRIRLEAIRNARISEYALQDQRGQHRDHHRANQGCAQRGTEVQRGVLQSADLGAFFVGNR